jgi:SAM-dependent methyltransferase
MRDNVKNIAAIVAESIVWAEPVVEIGSYQVAGQEVYADIRPFFKGRKFIGCDMREGPGVDRIENVEEMTFEDNSVGAMLMLDTLEHVANCHKAMSEAHRVLQPGGLAVIVSVMDFAVHLHPSDYWRFTPQGFDNLLAGFDERWVFMEGNPFCPHTVIGYAVKGGAAPPKGIDLLIDRTRAVATDIRDVDYDDPALLEAYPYHTAHDGYPLLASKARELADAKDELAQMAAELADIQRSAGWRMVRRGRQVKDALFPAGSSRGRAFQTIRRSLRGR